MWESNFLMWIAHDAYVLAGTRGLPPAYVDGSTRHSLVAK